MKFTVQRNTLLSALVVTGKAITNSPNSLMKCYRIAVVQNKCSITGSNTEIFLRQEIDVISEEELINICIPAEELIDYIKTIPDQPIHFLVKVTQNEKSESIVVNIKHNDGDADIPAESGELYPKFPDAGDVVYEIDASDFFDGVSRTTFAISPDEDKAISNYCIRMGNGIELAGCSGPVMSIMSVFKNTINSQDIVLSKSSAALLLSIPYEEKINISYTERNLVIDNLKNLKAAFIRVNMAFPDYRGMKLLDVPDEFNFILNTRQFEAALKRVTVFTDKDTGEIKITASGSAVKLETKNLKDQYCTENVAADVTGEIAIGFNSSFVLKAIKNIKSDVCQFNFTTFNGRVLLSEVQDAESDIKIVLSPVMLKW